MTKTTLSMTNGRSKRNGFRRNRYNNRYRNRQIMIPKYMSKKNKQNLKRNLITLGEKMYVPRVLTSTSVTDTAVVTDVTNITQGDGDVNRHGDQVALRSIEARWTWRIAGTSDDFTNTCRFIMFQWFPITTPTQADILVDASTPTLAVISNYNHDRRFDFKILIDVVTDLSNNGPAVKSYHKHLMSGFKRKVQYNVNTTTGNNEVYVMYFGDSAAIPHPQLTYSIKINYNDY